VTVKELIEQLLKYPPSLQVVIADFTGHEKSLYTIMRNQDKIELVPFEFEDE
jgi:hypothetical protein